MKTPFPAWRMKETEAGIQLLRVQVLEVFPITKTAYIAFGRTGRCHCPFDELATSYAKVSERLARAMMRVEENATELNLQTPAPDEKSAAVCPLAGAGAAV